MSSLREKRDVNKMSNNTLNATQVLAIGEVCIEEDNKCSKKAYCRCDGRNVKRPTVKVCSCALTWWFFILVVLAILVGLALLTFCINKLFCTIYK